MNNNCKRMCLCIPTQNRADMIADVLSYVSDYYPKYDMDIIYYDTSETDETKRIINNYFDNGFINLHYERMTPGQCVDYKIIDIFRNSKRLLDYKYIWLINDATSIFPEFLNELINITESDYDIIRLPHEGAESGKDYIIRDPNEWFHKCSKSMAYMASTIMNSRLLRGNIDWNALCDKYIGSNDIYDKEHGFFFTVGFYLERIAAIDDFKGLMIGSKRKWRRESLLKNGRSYWNNLIFDTWVRSYPETILKTPSCYTDKKEVIRLSENIMCGRFERQSLISLRIRGIFTEDVFLRFKDYWQYVTTLNESELEKISCMPRDVLAEQYGENYGRTDIWSQKLTDIEKEIGDKEIIIYGAGLYGTYSLEKLIRDGFEKNIVGMAVTSKSENVDSVMGVHVREITEYVELKDKAVVLIAVLPDTAKMIYNYLVELNFKIIYMLF